jgi:hypothetical protein
MGASLRQLVGGGVLVAAVYWFVYLLRCPANRFAQLWERLHPLRAPDSRSGVSACEGQEGASRPLRKADENADRPCS